MNIGVIDIESKTLSYLQSEYGHLGSIYAVEVNESVALASITQKAATAKYDAIAINIECKYEKSKRSALRGVELIYWLRLKENYLGTIITYGFLSSAQVLRLKPEYAVLHASGNYHFRLPLLQGLQNLPSIQTLTDINEYKKFLRSFINLEAIRHSSANYYALKNLKGIHKQITSTEIEITTPKAHTTMELVYDSYYGTNNKSQLEKEAETNLKKKIEKIENEVNELIAFNTSKKGNKWKRNIAEHPTEAYYHYKDILESMNQEKVQISNPKRRSFSESDYQARERDVKKYKIIVDRNKNKLRQKEQHLSQLQESLANDSVEEIAEKRIEELQGQLAELNSLNGKVVMVDDLAEEGWYSFYNAITGDTIALENQEIPNKKNEFEATTLATSILSKEPNLVLLDMRLYQGEEDALYPSGIQVLKELRRQNKIVPIIVCSASNRGSVINLIYQEGANYYWLKEGADLEYAFDESIKNYERLIHLLKTTLSVNQVKIQELYSRFQKEVVLSDKALWWENKEWGYSHTVVNLGMTTYEEFISSTTKVDNDYKLHQLFVFPLTILAKHILVIDDNGNLPNWMLCSSVIADLSNLIEYIHRFDILKTNEESLYSEYRKHKVSIPNIDKRIITSGYINLDASGVNIKREYGRNDIVGGQLYEMRNISSHFAGAETLTIDDVFKFTEKLLTYLINDNIATNPIRYFEKNKMWYFDRECTKTMNTNI